MNAAGPSVEQPTNGFRKTRHTYIRDERNFTT
jgi:hypothetical protein